MSNRKRILMSIEDDGTAVAIYSDDIRPLLKKGEAEIIRASHVEPEGDKWRVDLTPIGGPVLDRLYELRQDALDAEVEWIENNYL